MRIGTGFIAAVLLGAFWGAVWMIVIGLIFTLFAGEASAPQILIAALAGAVGAAIYVLAPVKTRDRPRARGAKVQAALIIAVFAVLMLLTFGEPFGLSMLYTTGLQVLALVGFLAAVWWSIIAGLHDQRAGNIGRYHLEIIFLRFMKGLGLTLFTIVVALPFYVMVMTSFKNQQSLVANPLDLSIDLGQGLSGLFSSYIELFTKYYFGTFLMNSAIVSVATVIITLVFAVPGAYAVARLRFPGQAFLSRSILLIYMVPAIVLVIPLYSVFSQFGLRNSLLGLMIVYPATTIPVALYMLQGYFRGLPSELEEAGLMDGLKRPGVIMKITLPLALPALASVALYVFMIAWNEFLFAFMFLDDIDMFTLSRGVVSLNSSEVPRQHLMAGAVIATVPVLFVFLWFERFLVAGLTAGSVKG
ncbi:carbohydrate ABC transporter permease [Martelella endophytica]|uniref:ABC transporter permease n=1 Tax=Martelella endophytica TaxID=1486262 RepID=A0A0D5LWJ9_MAREN|nr:carbohydrate ABC transporter permease [Martelella endophytica]AJY48177.1 ABC transporter permease [Martelella endophytica]